MCTTMSQADWISGEGQDDLVSVILPVYNRERLVRDALNSVQRQTYRPIEVIVVDDGSVDNTVGVVKAWAQAYAANGAFTVRCVLQENAGAPAARNHGVRVSTGAYIQYLDSDDLLLPHKIAMGVRALEQQHVDMAYCKTRITTLEGQVMGQCGLRVRNDPWELPAYSWHITGPLYRRRTVAALGPWLEHLTGSQDWEYCVRAKLGPHTLHFDPVVGSVYRRHTKRRISQAAFDLAYTRSAEQAYDHIIDLAEQHGKAAPEFYTRMARLYLYRGLEYQAYDHPDAAMRCLQKAATHGKASPVVQSLSTVCRWLRRPWAAHVLLWLVQRRNALTT
jgi:glycosyltransferase involved in cell wall biosynthesis